MAKKRKTEKVKRPKYLHQAGEVERMARTPRRKAPVARLTHEERVAAEREERRAKYEDKELRTVGVRFPSDPEKEYTYLVRTENVMVYLGMEVIVKNSAGVSQVAYITRLDDGVVMPSGYDSELKEITREVTDL